MILAVFVLLFISVMFIAVYLDKDYREFLRYLKYVNSQENIKSSKAQSSNFIRFIDDIEDEKLNNYSPIKVKH